MRQLPKVRKDLKTNFKNDEIEIKKLNYLQGGDGTGGGDGDDNGGQGGSGTWNPQFFEIGIGPIICLILKIVYFKIVFG